MALKHFGHTITRSRSTYQLKKFRIVIYYPIFGGTAMFTLDRELMPVLTMCVAMSCRVNGNPSKMMTIEYHNFLS